MLADMLSRAIDPTGTHGRLQFLLFAYVVPAVPYAVILLISQGSDGGLMAGAFLILLPLQIIAAIRRMHDLEISAWRLLWAFVPGALLVLYVYLIFVPGKQS